MLRKGALSVGLLDAYQDPGLEIDASVTQEMVVAAEQERLAKLLAMVVVTGSIPRRLSDASREELALDKRRARRVAHALRQSLVGWGGEERPPTEDEQREGAQLDWPTWAESAGQLVTARIRFVATWAKKTGNLRFGKTAMVRLTQEVDWVDYALRD